MDSNNYQANNNSDTNDKYLFPNEPVYFTPEDYDKILEFCGGHAQVI